MHLLFLLLTVVQDSPQQPLEVEGEYVITVKQLPFTVKSPKANFVSWHYPATTVVERRDNGDLLIHSMPAGESYFWADCGVIDFENQSTHQFIRGITLLNGLMPQPPPDTDPEDPEIPIDGGKANVIITENVAPDNIAEAAANEIRNTDGEEVFFGYPGVKDFDGLTPGYLQAALSKAREIGYPAIIIFKGGMIVAAEKYSTKQEILDTVRSVE